MEVGEQMALKDVRDQLSTVVDKVEREHDRVVITKHGRPAAVVVSIDDLESLEETVDVLSQPALLRQVRRSLDELRAGGVEPLSKDDALALVRRR
jgi:antitoxin YefM